jgi:hypothetical protein
MMCATRAEDVPSNPDRKQGQARSGLPSPFPVYIIRMGRPGQLTSLTVSVHSRAAEVCHMLRCMYFVQDKQTDFSVVDQGQASEPLEVGDLSRRAFKGDCAVLGVFLDGECS